MDHFLPFNPFNNLKNQILKKWKKHLEILSFYTGVPQMTIIWYMVLEISRAMDRIFCHFGPFLPFYPPPCPTPLTTWKIKTLKKKKKTPGDIIILHICTKNHDHLLYCSLDMAWNRCNCCFFILGYFLQFYLSNSTKNQNLTKMKKTPGDILFHNSAPKIMIICYTVHEIWYVTDVIIFHLVLFFALLNP